MITIDATFICDLPLSRGQTGFPKEGDHGNAVLLLAADLHLQAYAVYQDAGCIHEGVCITSCDEEIFAVLERLHLRYCPWPDRGFTLVMLEQKQMGVLADRMVVCQPSAAVAAKDDHADEREAGKMVQPA